MKISMVYIDCNAYLPAITALVSLEKNLSNGALLVVDEHQTGGETRALREFIGRKNKDIEIQDTGWEFPHGPKLTARWKKKGISHLTEISYEKLFSKDDEEVDKLL